MARSPRSIGIGAVLVALVAVLVWYVMAEPPREPAADTVSAATTPGTAMPKAIATVSEPAIVTVAPPATTRAVRAASALQLTVRPENVEKDRPYLVNVYTVPKDNQTRSPAKKPAAAPKPGEPGAVGKDEVDPNYVGSFSFFPPPSVGEVRTFTLPTPESLVPGGGNVTLRVELVPVEAEYKPKTSSLAILDARIATPSEESGPK